jgi:polyisoprenoid-binding protein YceI
MRILITLLAASTLTFAPSEKDQLNLYVEKTGLLSGKKHHFIFERFTGDASFDETNPANSRVTFQIDANSLVCKDTWVSQKDLVKVRKMALEEMLAAAKYPQIRFESNRVTARSASEFTVDGMLTIRDRTKPARVTVERTAAGRWKGESRVKLTDYGLKPPGAALGLVGTKDEMTFAFDLEAK